MQHGANFSQSKKAAIHLLPKISEYSVQAKLLQFPWSSVYYLWQLTGAALHGGMEQEQPRQELQNAESRDNSRINCYFSNIHPCKLLDLRYIVELATKCSLWESRIKEASKGFRPDRSIMPSINKEVSMSASGQRRGSKQNPQLPPFNWILIKCEHANTAKSPSPSKTKGDCLWFQWKHSLALAELKAAGATAVIPAQCSGGKCSSELSLHSHEHPPA